MNNQKTILAGPFFLLALLVAATPLYAIGSQAGMMGKAHATQTGNVPALLQGWQCPSQAGRDMGAGMPGTGRPHGYGTAPGKMEPAKGNGNGADFMPQQQKPPGKEQARQTVEDYLKSIRKPDLKLGRITDEGQYYEVKIVKKDNDKLVDLIIVDKNTGCMRSML